MIWFKSNCWSNFSWIMHFLGWQIKCLKDPCIKNGPIWASSKYLPFFLDVTSKLFQHISGFSDVKYQMTWCMEHEKYPNCVRLSTVVSVIDDLLVTVDRNTLYLFSSVSNMSNVVCRVISNYGEAQSPHLIHGHHSIQAQNSDPDMSQLCGRCLMAVTNWNFVHSESKIK